MGIVLIGPASASAQLRPEPGAIEFASGDLLDRLRADPFAYFRFVNRSWTTRVCEVFADEMRDLPIARLHGDAHVEQFAVTKDAWGLDDFDDSARGPALVDSWDRSIWQCVSASGLPVVKRHSTGSLRGIERRWQSRTLDRLSRALSIICARKHRARGRHFSNGAK
jgi:hypothetical protein